MLLYLVNIKESIKHIQLNVLIIYGKNHFLRHQVITPVIKPRIGIIAEQIEISQLRQKVKPDNGKIEQIGYMREDTDIM